jgi:lauroyl/myristoyl acyltransferase
MIAGTQPLADALAEVERPKAHLLRPYGESLLGRVYATPAVHWAVPTPLAARLARARGELEWRLLERRRHQATAELEQILGRSPTPEQVRRRIVYQAVEAELAWRPGEVPKIPIDGFEHIQRARAGGRGVILAGSHIGSMRAMALALAARGLKIYISGGHPPEHPLPPGRAGRWTMLQNRWTEEFGARWVFHGGSYELVRELVRRGEVWVVAADGHGSTEVELCGRRVQVGSGMGRIALETGAAIVPGFGFVRGYRCRGVFVEAIEPTEADDPQTLTQRVADAITKAVSVYPEQVHGALLDILTGVSLEERRLKLGLG